MAEGFLSRMLSRLEHRGPDSEGTMIEGSIGLGHRRLSIIDLSAAGNQPMPSDDGRFVIVYNGEVYNYLELRAELEPHYAFRTRTDTEVLLNAYRHWGEGCLDRLNGMFAFAVWDRAQQRLFAARDRFGVKPFYYSLDQGRFLFASEIPALLAVHDSRPRANDQAIFDYLVFNRTDASEDTFFQGIQRLSHGHVLTVEGGRVRPRRWYDLASRLDRPFRDPDEFRATLSSAVGLRLRSDVPVGTCLSGGLDSSTIVSLLVQEHARPDIHTFSAVYGSGIRGDESAFIDLYRPLLPNMHKVRPTADMLLTDLTSFVCAHAEPMPSSSPYAQYKVMELAKQHVVVTLDGQGADEQLAGYHPFFGVFFRELLRNRRLGRLTSEVLHYLRRHRSPFGLLAFLFLSLPPSLQTRSRATLTPWLQRSFYLAHRDSTLPEQLYQAGSLRQAHLNHFEHKLEHLLKWVDRNSMHFGLESRTPFLDFRVVEGTLALGSDLLIRDGTTKHILREATRGILPEPIRARQDKVGFSTPQDEWLRTPGFRRLIWGLLKSRSFRERGYVNPDRAEALYERHLLRRVDASRDVWKWLNLELWFREYIDNTEATGRQTTLTSAMLPRELTPADDSIQHRHQIAHGTSVDSG